MNKTVLSAIVAVVFLGLLGGGYILFSGDDSTQSNATETSNSTLVTEPTTTQSSETFTTSQVAEHSTESDCWTIINDNVYDISSYVPRHPGGDEILSACGADGTSLFENRTTDDGQKVGSGTPHSSSATSQLEEFQIGQIN